MLLPNQMVQTKWTKQNKDYYEKLGYTFTKFNKYFEIKAEDLSCQSHIKVKVICDNCLSERNMPWRDYLRYHSDKFGDLCINCCRAKTKDTCLSKYGKENPSQVDIFKEKRKKTHIEKFGVENAFQAEACKNKSRQTNLKKYGTEYASQNKEVKNKTQATCLKRFGVACPSKSEQVKQKSKKTCLERYGCEYSLSCPEVREKGRQTLYENGNIPTSKPEKETCNLLKQIYGKENCYPGYPLDRLNFDCLLVIDDVKIDVEYDGWYFHSKNQQYDNRRNRFVISKGYKVLRIKGNYQIPAKDELKEAIDCLVKGNYSYKEIILDI